MSDTSAGNRFTKKTLVTVSHAIEQAALAAAEDGPMVVIALFQRMPYFERERAVYTRIARQAAVTLVGVVDDPVPELPAGAQVVLLDEKENLAREWTVVVLTPRFGAFLIAEDQEDVDGDAATIESGRIFHGRFGYRRDDALHEVLRLRARLADRLPAAAVAAVDAVVSRVRELPSGPGEARTDASLRQYVAQAVRDDARMNGFRRRAETMAGQIAAGQTATGQTGTGPSADMALTSADDTRRWSGAAGVTSSGVLPVALLAVRVGALPATVGTGGRTAARQEEATIGLLISRLRPADRATRVAPGEFLLFLPALAYDDTVSFAYRLNADFAAAAQRSAFLSAAVTVALTVTRRRPLPVEEIRQALQWAVNEGIPVATIDG